MTDLKPISRDGADNPNGTQGGFRPANIEPAQPTAAQTAPIERSRTGINAQAAAPTKPAQTNAAHTADPPKPDPAVKQPAPLQRRDTAPAAGLTAVTRMMACTQPGCTGTIVDDYCDVCGSPANAPAFVPAQAAVTAESPAPAVGPVAIPPMTACTQPGCTGTIVDDYCDVCGSPANTHAFVSVETAARVPAKPAEPDAAQIAVTTKPSPPSAQAASPSKPSVPVKHAQAAMGSRPSPADAERVATPGKRRRVLSIVLASVVSTLVAVLAVAAISIYRVDRSLSQSLDREDLLPTDSSTALHPTKGQTAPRPTKGQGAADALNFVLIGYDSRDAGFGSSSSLMILHLNAK